MTEPPAPTTGAAGARDARDEVVFRRPELRDGAAVWRLVEESGVLDRNSPYLYLMWCERFADASIVAEVGGELAGFVCGFRPPRDPDVLFVWQVGVSGAHRGLGIGGRMLSALVAREPDLRFVEATVTPSNEPSQRLFRGLARRLDCPCREEPHLRAEDFPSGADHEPETLFRIGPFDPGASSSSSDETEQ